MALELRNIHKHFGSVRANNGITMSVEAGTLHGLLGENGAGKSTLMKVLSGFHEADVGEVILDGETLDLSSPRNAMAAGIGMLHQDPLVFLPLSVLDNLIERLEIPPMIVAMTQAGDRLREYAGDPDHAAFIAEELLPLMQGRLPIDDSPLQRALMGASFGAVASLSTAWRYPGLFDRLMLLSGSFAFSDIGTHQRGPVFDPVVEFMNQFRLEPGRPARRIYIACGIYESLIYENRSIVPLLQAQNIQVRFEEVRDGHNWENWRDRLRGGLSWLFPGPLWMIYE